MKSDNLKMQDEDELEEEAVDEGEKVIDELEALKQQVGDFENRYRRALADYQNLQKRVQEEKSEWIRSANKDLILRILTVLDTLMLAQQHVQDKGLEVSINQFVDVLKAEGATKIKTVGEKFDPNLMEGIATGEGDEGIVLEELRAGFMLYDKLLRAAQVKVGKKN